LLLELCLRVRDYFSTVPSWDYSEEDTRKEIMFNGIKLEGQSNSMGLRDKEYRIDHGTYRILAIGDSFTYGYQLKEQNSWPRLAEKYLWDCGYKDIEILNGGRPGSDTKWQLDFFSKFTVKYKPDMVIIGFVINDCTDVCQNCKAVELKKKLDKFIKSRKSKYSSYLLNYIKLMYLKRKLTEETVRMYSVYYDKNLQEFQDCKNAFLGFKELAKKNNFELIVVICPVLYELNNRFPFLEIHKKINNFLSLHGIKCYDLTPEYYGYKDTKLWLRSDDSHPNKIANQIAGKRIAEIIKQNLGDSYKESRVFSKSD
jgi:lysophospholipase L1-like esterase